VKRDPFIRDPFSLFPFHIFTFHASLALPSQLFQPLRDFPPLRQQIGVGAQRR
jgi:hypothetical protein